MAATIIEPEASRMLPELTDENRGFYTGGADGQLLIQRCATDGRWIHPPVAACPTCGGALHDEPVSGKGTIFTFTLNLQKFHPDHQPPNLVALVALDEQDDLRIITNIVGATVENLWCGMPVQVLFERHGEVFYPVFEPTRSEA
jgi:uncharacterized OB-fold protein